MTITDVRLMLPDGPAGMVLAYAEITIGHALAIHDLRLIRTHGRMIVSMPSKRLTSRCPGCGTKNPQLSRFCGHCGLRLAPAVEHHHADGTPRIHQDICHPITPGLRAAIESAVIAAYEAEAGLVREPAGPLGGRLAARLTNATV